MQGDDAAASSAKVAEMILKAPRLHQNSIDQALNDDDIIGLNEFETKWIEFLTSNPNVLPPGEKLKNCLELENQLEEIKMSKQMVQMELQRQLDFFTQSKDQLEKNFTRAMEEAALTQQEVSRNLNKEIDDIAVADQILSKTLPWEHFFDNLEAAAEKNNVFDGLEGSTACSSSTNTNSRGLKPSKQAMYLAHNLDQGEVARAAMEGKSSALLLRAFKIDNAILKAQVKMMQLEDDRLQRTTKSQQELAKFLSEYNIWGLLSKSNNNGAGGTTTNTTVAGRSTTATTIATKKTYLKAPVSMSSTSTPASTSNTNPLTPSRAAAVASRLPCSRSVL